MSRPALPSTPTTDPDPASEQAWRSWALAYLRNELGPRAPQSLGPAAYFDASVLDDDGPVVIFPFVTPIGDEQPEHYVVVGRTVPNYYPRWTLSLDDAFHVHLGTRFMLVVGVAQASDAERASVDPAAELDQLLAKIYPGEKVENPTLAALFKVGDELHAVCRCRIAGEETYAMTRACPPGFYRRTELPPHVVYRMHLGSLLLRERDNGE